MSWQSERARIAGLSRDRVAEDPDLIEARRNLRAERLALAIQQAVDAAPPLSAERLSAECES